MMSPSVPVSCTCPVPGTKATSTSMTSPPDSVQASPLAMPTRSPSSNTCLKCVGGPKSTLRSFGKIAFSCCLVPSVTSFLATFLATLEMDRLSSLTPASLV